jgi:hypothetical protein
MNDTHWNTISNVYTLGQIRHIIYVQCPHTGIFVSFMGITSRNHRIRTEIKKKLITITVTNHIIGVLHCTYLSVT